MPNGFQFDVFLSHSAKDKAVVRPLAERLRQDRPGLQPSASSLFLTPPSKAPWRSSFTSTGARRTTRRKVGLEGVFNH